MPCPRCDAAADAAAAADDDDDDDDDDDGDAENAGLENVGPNGRGGKDGTGKRRTKFPEWKTHDHRLLNAKWISIKLKGILLRKWIRH